MRAIRIGWSFPLRAPAPPPARQAASDPSGNALVSLAP